MQVANWSCWFVKNITSEKKGNCKHILVGLERVKYATHIKRLHGAKQSAIHGLCNTMEHMLARLRVSLNALVMLKLTDDTPMKID